MNRNPALQPIPPDVVCAGDYEAHAQRALDADAWAYFNAHAGVGLTAQCNRAAWDEMSLVPRVLRPLAGLHTGTQLLGQVLPCPLLVAPMALQRWAHPDGELAMAMAAAAQGTGMVLSSQASLPLESVANAVRHDSVRGPLWFQLYFLPQRSDTLDLVRRAERAGYEALVLTVDASVRAARSIEHHGLRLPHGITAVNLPAAAAAPAAGSRLQTLLAQAPTWDDVAWLQSQTRLPLLLKGVLHPEDAREAARLKVSGLIVSNHGGRTLDTAAATAVALPYIADSVGDSMPVLVDGGIRRGTDVLKALALGARAVLVGRPLLWALASAGAAGVAHALRLLRDELELAMAQCGVASLEAIRADLLLPPNGRLHRLP